MKKSMRWLVQINKTIIVLAMVAISGCVLHVEEKEPVPCGYDEQPYYEAPLYCDADSWTYEDECCTWVVQGYYDECVESWCYSEYACGWSIDQRSCYPI